MKTKLLSKYMLVGLVAAALAGCHDISESERFIELPTLEPLDNQRAVLLEEFTGQECVNCPGAHEIVAQLAAQYPETFIPVSIHAGPFAWTEKYDGLNEGFGVDEGAALAKARGVNSYPAGIMDRATEPRNAAQWASDLRTRLAVPAAVQIEMTTDYAPAVKQLTVTTTLVADQPLSGNLQLWVVESGLVGYQILLDGSEVEDYVHNHVFRGTVNGLDGTPFTIAASDDPLEHGRTTLTHTLDIKDHWTVANMHIVAIVDNNGAVENAASVAALPFQE